MSRRPVVRQATLRTDRPAMARVIAGAVAVVALVAGGISLHALMTVGSWMGLPGGTTWAPALLLDGGAVAWTLAAYVRRAQERTTTAQWSMVGIAAVVSAAANGAVIVLGGDLTPQRVIGAALSALAPIWAALAAHQVADLIVATPAPKPAATPVASAPVLEPASAPTAAAAPRPAPRPAPARAPRATDAERDAQRARALELAAEGMSQRAIATEVGVPKTTVARWVSDRTDRTLGALPV